MYAALETPKFQPGFSDHCKNVLFVRNVAFTILTISGGEDTLVAAHYVGRRTNIERIHYAYFGLESYRVGVYRDGVRGFGFGLGVRDGMVWDA